MAGALLCSPAAAVRECSLLVHVPRGCLVSEPQGGEVQGVHPGELGRKGKAGLEH